MHLLDAFFPHPLLAGVAGELKVKLERMMMALLLKKTLVG